jgi:galactosamine-6-phosphate isomerase
MKSPILVCNGAESLSRKAAKRILTALCCKPDLLLCAAGGSTPLRTYQLLVRHRAQQPKAFRKLRVIKLDEWGGLPMGGPGTCEQQLAKCLLGPLGVSGKRYLGFRSDPPDSARECARIRRCLDAEGPIDLCVLGLGLDGHVAMNEPAPALQPRAHVARLADATLRHPMLAESRTAPTCGLTLGMAEIFASREILLLVSGANKREPLRRLMRREITTECPASFLWLHPNWTLLCDREAAVGLDLESS